MEGNSRSSSIEESKLSLEIGAADDLSSFDTLYYKDLTRCNLANRFLGIW